jgi:hypothetical protein
MTTPANGGGGGNGNGTRYQQSYIIIGALVGIIGVLLPFVFIIGEAFFLRGGVHVRGSISAYYHTSMRDMFVAGLCVTGFLLATYRSSEVRKPEFWLSLGAGVAVIGVVFFPTGRPGLAENAQRCGTTPEPVGCSAVQQYFGEVTVAAFHFGFALAFILMLAAISFVFARHPGNKASKLQIICGLTIVAAVLGVVIGELNDFAVWELTALYLGEVISVWAFAVSWLAESRRAWREI